MLRRAINCTEELVQLSNTATAYPSNARQLRNTLNKIHELKVRTVKETRTQQKDKVSLEFFSETHANLFTRYPHNVRALKNNQVI